MMTTTNTNASNVNASSNNTNTNNANNTQNETRYFTKDVLVHIPVE